MRRGIRRIAGACVGAVLLLAAALAATASPAEPVRSGREIYRQFSEGLSTPACGPGVSPRWRKHFAAAPGRLAAPDSDTLALFGYVVDALRDSSLPTEYALIPFVESGYRPDARSPAGPAGLWQMIRRTARNHQVPIRPGYDGRLSPVDSTRAAVRYLKTLHGMFAGDWRLAAMAYNAGEYRVLGALRQAGQVARDARPAELPGLPDITHAYVRKLRAIACVLDEAADNEEWLQALDRPVPRLQPVEIVAEYGRLDAWASAHGHDAARLRRLNPVFVAGRIRHGDAPLRLLAPPPATPVADQELGLAESAEPTPGVVTMGDAAAPAGGTAGGL
jgi:membrane-bound lytic murein transglycosylase D